MNKHPLKDQFSRPFWMFENEVPYFRKCFMLIPMETRISKHGNTMCGMKLGNTSKTAYLLDPNVIFIYTFNKDNEYSQSPHTCRQHVKETDDSHTWTASVAKTAEIRRWGWGERPYKKTAVVRRRRDQTEIWQQWGSPRSARSFKGVSLDQITRHYIVIELLHFTAVAGWYMKTFYVSYIHHQLIFHELFIWRPLTLLAGKTSPMRIRGKSRGRLHYTPAISGEVVRRSYGWWCANLEEACKSAWFPWIRCSSGVRLNINVTTKVNFE